MNKLRNLDVNTKFRTNHLQKYTLLEISISRLFNVIDTYSLVSKHAGSNSDSPKQTRRNKMETNVEVGSSFCWVVSDLVKTI